MRKGTDGAGECFGTCQVERLQRCAHARRVEPPRRRERSDLGFALQRGGEPHEIVGAALYFASAASSYTTGALLDIVSPTECANYLANSGYATCESSTF